MGYDRLTHRTTIVLITHLHILLQHLVNGHIHDIL